MARRLVMQRPRNRMIWILCIGGLTATGSVAAIIVLYTQGRNCTAGVYIDEPYKEYRYVAAEHLEHAFRIKNPTSTTVEIQSVRKSCSCTDVALNSWTIEPGGEGVLNVRLSLDKPGRNEATIIVHTAAGVDMRARLVGCRPWPLKIVPNIVKLTNVPIGGRQSVEVVLYYRCDVDAPDLKVNIESRGHPDMNVEIMKCRERIGSGAQCVQVIPMRITVAPKERVALRRYYVRFRTSDSSIASFVFPVWYESVPTTRTDEGQHLNPA